MQLLGLTLYPLCGQHTPGGKEFVGLRNDHLQSRYMQLDTTASL